MRSPRLIYLAVAAVLAVAGFALTQYLADRSTPGLGETIVVPAGASGPTTQPSSPTKTTNPSSEPGAAPVSPAPVRTAGDDDDRDNDGLDDNLDNAPDDGADD